MKTYKELLEEQNNLGKNFEKYRDKTEEELEEEKEKWKRLERDDVTKIIYRKETEIKKEKEKNEQ